VIVPRRIALRRTDAFGGRYGPFRCWHDRLASASADLILDMYRRATPPSSAGFSAGGPLGRGGAPYDPPAGHDPYRTTPGPCGASPATAPAARSPSRC
jgi:hypothetical protein